MSREPIVIVTISFSCLLDTLTTIRPTLIIHNETKVKSVKLEKTFDFDIEFGGIGLSVMFLGGEGLIQ